MGVREERLLAEFEAIKRFRSKTMTWEAARGNPPDEYRFTYALKSIVVFNNKAPVFHKGFVVEVKFPLEFPRKQPIVRLVGEPKPFHPNIWADGRFCLEGSQHWIPGIGVPLDSLCQMVGEIIAFQTFNLDSPANNDRTLRDWLLSNAHNLPIDNSAIRLPDIEDTIRWGREDNNQRIRFGE